MVTGRVQSHTMVAIVVLFGLGILTSTVITRRADGQAAVDYEKINRQLEQAVKALASGVISAAVKYLEETAHGLPAGEAKTHVAVAIDGLRYTNDTETARMHVQLAQSSLQGSTG